MSHATAKYISFDSPLLQNWPEQIYPPNGYVFPKHDRKVWKHRNGSRVSPQPVVIPAKGADDFHRFDFGPPQSLGFPCFESRKALLAARPWRAYFKRVYGELPNTFPLCVSQFSQLYSSLASSLNLSLPVSQYDICEQDGPSKRVRSWSKSVFPTWMIYILHYDLPRTPVSHNTWVEVTHHSRCWKEGYERQGLWFSVSAGTGVWFNTGNTIAFREHAHAFQYFQSQWETDLAVNARDAGYDTIQFTLGDGMPHKCCRKLGLQPNCFGLELMSTRLVGNYACGGKDSLTAYRSGWRAQRPCVCTEDNMDASRAVGRPSGYVNCMGTASNCVNEANCAKSLAFARRAAWNRRRNKFLSAQRTG